MTPDNRSTAESGPSGPSGARASMRWVALLWIALGVVLVCFLYFYRAGAIGLTGPDEPRYAEVAKEMLLAHDYVTPRLMGQPWFEKPALFYWCAALSFKLIGVSDAAARLPSAIGALLLVLALALIPRSFLTARVRFLSALVLATSLGTIAFAHAASTDMLFTSTFSIAMLFFYEGLCRKEPSRLPWGLYAGYVFLGLSVLAKGPVGALLAGAIVLCYFWVARRWKDIRRLHLPTGVAIFLVVTLPWYLLCYRDNGWAFFETFIVQHNLMRFATNEFKHSQPFWFYVPVILGAMMPWSPFFVMMAARLNGWSMPAKWEGHGATTFPVVWMIFPLLFFTLAESKLPGYVLPVLIPISILLGKTFAWGMNLEKDSDQERRFTRSLRWSYGVEILFFALLLAFHRQIIARFRFTPAELDRWFVFAGAAMILFLLYCVFSPRRLRVALTGHAVFMGLLVVLISSFLLPGLDSQVSTRPMAQAIQSRSAETPVFLLNVSRDVEYGLDYYLTPAPIVLHSSADLEAMQPRADYCVVAPPDASLRNLGAEISASDLIYQSHQGFVSCVREGQAP